MLENVKFNSQEILFLTALTGAVRLEGISDSYYGMSEGEIAQAINKVINNLVDRKLAQYDFEGNLSINNDVYKAFEICGKFRKYVMIFHQNSNQMKREMFYLNDRGGTKIYTDDNTYLVSDIEEKNVFNDIKGFANIVSSANSNDSSVTLSSEQINTASETFRNSFTSSDGKKKLISYGCSEQMADILSEMLSVKADVYLLTAVAQKEDSIYSDFAFMCSTKCGSVFVKNVDIDEDRAVNLQMADKKGFISKMSEIFESAGIECEVDNID